jgi:nucleoside-diphosphate-sugar epimerase
MLACIAPQSACGETFNVGCGTRISVNDLWRRIAALAGCSAEPLYAPARTGDVHDSLASLERSQRELGYAPAVTIEEGLERTVEWYTVHKAVIEASAQHALASHTSRVAEAPELNEQGATA